ncbi:MAG: hypothetical protein OEU86_01135, partial [Gammaproteobacteria bacterium]|nr:hypothetical protein [Gammaproteobacteria bacterium]
MTDASAPGKLVIAGEYAVLEGAPALAASIDVRAQARVASISTPESVFFDALSGRAYFFNIDHERGLHWLEGSPGQSGKLLEAALSACLQHLKNYRQIPVIRVSMNSDAFYGRSGEQWQKLGIGSSAAVTV